jgi:hypothetical protein
VPTTRYAAAPTHARTAAIRSRPSKWKRTCIGRSLFLPSVSAKVENKTPFQTVHADFPHTAYRWSVDTQHYATSCFQKGCSGAASPFVDEQEQVAAQWIPTESGFHQAMKSVVTFPQVDGSGYAYTRTVRVVPESSERS